MVVSSVGAKRRGRNIRQDCGYSGLLNVAEDHAPVTRLVAHRARSRIRNQRVGDRRPEDAEQPGVKHVVR